ncbi:hypothetical protein B0H11DRAFT_1686541, partial [Mycena galericulata]
ALYDSADSYPQPRYDAKTRTKMLDDLYKWAVHDDSDRPVCWLHGPAGAGKSAIMQTVPKIADNGSLGRAFFFKRGHMTRGNAKVLFATLACQLAYSNHNLRPAISSSVDHDPPVVGRSMDTQLRKLIVESCQSL